MLKRAFAVPDFLEFRVRGFLHSGGCLFQKALCLFVLLRSSAPLLLFFLAPLLLCIPSAVHAQVTWGPDVRLTYAPWESESPQVVVWKDTIYVVWIDRRIPHSPASEEVYFKRSLDGGTTWNPDLKLSLADSGAIVTGLAARHDTVHVVWYDYRSPYVSIYYRRSTDAGSSWGAETPLSSFRQCFNPAIALGDGGDVYVIWDDQTGGAHLQTFSKSTDGGNTWGRDTVIGQKGGSGIPPELVYSRGVLHLIKDQLGTSSTVEVVYRRTTDRGLTWSSDRVVSQVDSIHSFWPRMAADSLGNIHISWADYKYSPYPWTGDIFYRRSTDNGVTWQPIQEFVYQHRAVASDVACDWAQVYLAWEDSRNGPNSNFEIYFQVSSNKGVTWGPEERLTYAPYNSNWPRLGAALSQIHLIWSDARDDTIYNGIYQEIYYKRGLFQVGVEERGLAKKRFEWDLKITPNPYVGKAWIEYVLPRKANVSLKIYDVSGRQVREVLKESQQAGRQEAFWDGKDEQGEEVDAGVYFLRMEAGGEVEVQRIVRLK